MSENTNIQASGTEEVKLEYVKPPPLNEKLLLLQEGGVLCLGQWTEGSGLIAWSRPPKRDKALERQLVALGTGLNPNGLRKLVVLKKD